MALAARWWLASAYRSISSRPIPHLAAIMSAARNWEISSVPYRSRQPAEPLNGSSKPNGWPASIAAAIGIWLMFCTPPATTRSAVPLITACAAKCTACWDEPHWRSTVTPGTASGRPGRQPRGPRDVARLRPDRVHAAEHHVVDGQRIDAGAVQQRADHVRAEVGRVRAGQPAAPLGRPASGPHRPGTPRPSVVLHWLQATQPILERVPVYGRYRQPGQAS